MTMHFELVVITACCDRPRRLSHTVVSIWSVAGEVYGTYRCKDGDDCEEREQATVRELAAPLLKRLEN